jgi:hypothetical protein
VVCACAEKGRISSVNAETAMAMRFKRFREEKQVETIEENSFEAVF